MNSLQIEMWALSVAQNVIDGKPNEDSRVELKAAWTNEDFSKTARQLAAHANLARGEPILWIIGIDQKQRIVPGADHQELSSWYQKVIAEFDEGIAPTIKDLNIPFDGKTIVALYFETERFPYVVKYKDDILIVPWREGTRTRTAHRQDLLKLLTPLQILPSLEVLGSVVEVQQRSMTHPQWNIHTEFYIEPNGDKTIIIPFHRCDANIDFLETGYKLQFSDIRLFPPYGRRGTGTGQSYNTSLTIESNQDEIMVDGPGRIIFKKELSVKDLPSQLDLNHKIIFTFSILPAYAQVPVRQEIVLKKVENIDPKTDPYITHKWLLE